MPSNSSLVGPGNYATSLLTFTSSSGSLWLGPSNQSGANNVVVDSIALEGNANGGTLYASAGPPQFTPPVTLLKLTLRAMAF
jgi:hypothetical protein